MSPRLAPGTYHVKDPAVRQLITDQLIAAGTLVAQVTKPLGGAAARERITELEAEAAQVQQLLESSIAKLEGERAARRQVNDEAAALRQKTIDLETELAHAQKKNADLTADLEKAKAEPGQPRPLHGNSTRARDREAFAALARRMDQQAATQPKDRSAALRIASHALREEIDTVYGPHGRKAAS